PAEQLFDLFFRFRAHHVEQLFFGDRAEDYEDAPECEMRFALHFERALALLLVDVTELDEALREKARWIVRGDGEHFAKLEEDLGLTIATAHHERAGAHRRRLR